MSSGGGLASGKFSGVGLSGLGVVRGGSSFVIVSTVWIASGEHGEARKISSSFSSEGGW